MSATTAISTTGLRKSYQGRTVLSGIDLTVPTGTVMALLGPNGAGKTTVVRILSTLIRADGGSASVAGHDIQSEPDAVRARIGVTGQFSAVDGLLSARENLQLMADLHHLDRSDGRARVADLLALFDLEDVAGRPGSALSGGMRRRLDLAMTLVGDPDVIFLDEPTTGLDPRSRRTMWRIIRDLVSGGVSVLLTTQYLDEADHLADAVALLDHGKLIAQGTPAELKRLIPGGRIRLHFADLADLDAADRVLDDGIRDVTGLTLDVPGDGSARSLRVLLDDLDQARADVVHLSVHTPDLDDVFLALTGPTDPHGRTEIR